MVIVTHHRENVAANLAKSLAALIAHCPAIDLYGMFMLMFWAFILSFTPEWALQSDTRFVWLRSYLSYNEYIASFLALSASLLLIPRQSHNVRLLTARVFIGMFNGLLISLLAGAAAWEALNHVNTIAFVWAMVPYGLYMAWLNWHRAGQYVVWL